MRPELTPEENKGVLLSVIIPAYNEGAVIENTLTKITGFLSGQDYGWEVIVVDDASTDSTVNIIKQFTANHPGAKVRLLVNERNSQKEAAIRRGILEANGEYAVFLDADYAYPIDQIGNFLSRLENGADIVIGNRTDPATTYFVRPSSFNYIYQRYLLSRAFNLLVRLLLVKDIQDTQCGIKAFQTRKAKIIMDKMRIPGFAFDAELLHIAQKNGRKIVQVPVTFDYIDEPSSVHLFVHSLIMFKSLIQIKLNGLMKRYELNLKSNELPSNSEGN